MMTLHMFRHGDTEASGDGTFCGELDIPLAQTGSPRPSGSAFVAPRSNPTPCT